MAFPVNETTLRVRYAETDAQGVVYHSNHVIYFEVGRGAYLRDLGFDYNDMEAAGVMIVVVDLHVRYRAAARYDDELRVVTTLSELGSRSMRFSYELWKGDTFVASGETAHVCLDRQGRPVAVPANLRAVLVAQA
jgi:acyl-CoA thioester hydrolase